MLAEVGRHHGNGGRLFECRCECGAVVTLNGGKLARGHTKSCGCLRRARGRDMLRKHGGAGSPEWLAWVSMQARCTDPGYAGYHRYGGRGIRVHAPWSESFEVFLASVGPRPSPTHSLDRIDNDGHYEPGNVRWADVITQARNRSSNVRMTKDGETMTIVEWSARLGLSHSAIRERLKRGWSIERALTPRPSRAA